jgi:hypothetical protein
MSAMNIVRDEWGATREQVTVTHNDGRRTIYTEDYRGRVSVVQVGRNGKPTKAAILRDAYAPAR